MLKTQGAVEALERNDIVNAATNALDGLRLFRFVWKFIWTFITVIRLSCVLTVLNFPAKTWIIWNKVPPKKFFFQVQWTAPSTKQRVRLPISEATRWSWQTLSSSHRRSGDPVKHIIINSVIIITTTTSKSAILFCGKSNLQWYLQPGACQDQQGDATLDEGKATFLLCQGFGIFIELYILDLSFISRIINLTGWHTTTQITWNNGTMTICTCKRQTSFLSPWINDLNVFLQGSFDIIKPPVWLWTWLWPLRLQPQPITTTTHQWPTVAHLPDWLWNWYRCERPAYCWRLLRRLPWSSDRLSRLSITAKKLDFLIRSSSREPETLKARSFGGLKRRFRGKSKNNSDS